MSTKKVIGILGAMEVEIEEFREKYNVFEVVELAGFSFHRAQEGDKEVVFCYSKVGKVFSTMAASIMISRFGVQHLVFSGIAGALNPGYKVLDICVATKTCQHDIDITHFGHPKGYISESEGVYINCQNSLFELAKITALENDYDLKTGVIATGDQFVDTPEKKAEIRKEFDADMIEMEGGSVAVVASAFKIPFIIVRTISDSATGDGLMEFNEFMHAAAKKNAEFITRVIREI